MDFGLAVSTLKEIEDDAYVPKNVRAKVVEVIRILEKGDEPSLRVCKALHELEDITDDVNVQADTRMRLYQIASLLERNSSIKAQKISKRFFGSQKQSFCGNYK